MKIQDDLMPDSSSPVNRQQIQEVNMGMILRRLSSFQRDPSCFKSKIKKDPVNRALSTISMKSPVLSNYQTTNRISNASTVQRVTNYELIPRIEITSTKNTYESQVRFNPLSPRKESFISA